MRQREYDRAVALLDSALAKDPHHVAALVDRAIVWRKTPMRALFIMWNMARRPSPGWPTR